MDEAVALIFAASVFGCGGTEPVDPPRNPSPYATEVVRFTPGQGSGYGQDQMPAIVLGPPVASSPEAGSLDVVSLGVAGEIVLGFDVEISDRPGDDFVVFENAFWVKGDPADPFYELGEVSISVDGVAWEVFACAVEGDGNGRWPGCAGWTPANGYDVDGPLDPETSGGNAFDLADVGLSSARFVRIRDLADDGDAPSAGFDLDAVGLVHYNE